MANSEASQAIINRFFDLVLTKYRNLNEFARETGFNKQALYESYANHASNRFQLDWIQKFCEVEKANINYIFTGKGKRFI